MGIAEIERLQREGEIPNLKQYCENEDLNYNSVRSSLSRYRKHNNLPPAWAIGPKGYDPKPDFIDFISMRHPGAFMSTPTTVNLTFEMQKKIEELAKLTGLPKTEIVRNMIKYCMDNGLC
jgi:hypothetical protein